MREYLGETTTAVLAVGDCRETVSELVARGVNVATEPEEVSWAIHANVEDLYGNPDNLVEAFEE